MAEQVGVIEYEVRAETAQAIASSKQMDVALSQIEKSAKSTDAGMHKLNTTMTATATIPTIMPTIIRTLFVFNEFIFNEATFTAANIVELLLNHYLRAQFTESIQ